MGTRGVTRFAGDSRFPYSRGLGMPGAPPLDDLTQLLVAWSQGEPGDLDRLAAIDPRQARVVELRYFAGLSASETAAALEVSLATVNRDWAMARAWLFRELGGTP